MKTHQKGNTIESDLSFIFVGFLTFWISPTNRGKAQRGESTCQLLNGPSNVFDVCSEKFFLSTHQRNLGVHRADDMCISDRVCADASNRWHVHKWFLGYVRLNRCHLPLVYIFYRVLKGPGVSKGKRELGNPKDSVWEDWGTLGKIRGITSY